MDGSPSIMVELPSGVILESLLLFIIAFLNVAEPKKLLSFYTRSCEDRIETQVRAGAGASFGRYMKLNQRDTTTYLQCRPISCLDLPYFLLFDIR